MSRYGRKNRLTSRQEEALRAVGRIFGDRMRSDGWDRAELRMIDRLKYLHMTGQPRDEELEAFLRKRDPTWRYCHTEGLTVRAYADLHGMDRAVVLEAARAARDRFHELLRAGTVPECDILVGQKVRRNDDGTCAHCGVVPVKAVFCSVACRNAHGDTRWQKIHALGRRCEVCDKPLRRREAKSGTTSRSAESPAVFFKRRTCGPACATRLGDGSGRARSRRRPAGSSTRTARPSRASRPTARKHAS